MNNNYQNIKIICKLFLLLLVAITLKQAQPNENTGFFLHPVTLAQTARSGIYDPTSQSWNWTGITILAGTALTSSLSYMYADPTLNAANDSPKMGNVSTWLSTFGEYSPFALPLLFWTSASLFQENNSFQQAYTVETAKILTQSLTLTFVTSSILKFSIQRERPDQLSHLSFPSNHSSLAFASAAVIAYRYPWYAGITSLVCASAIGASRIDLNKHYISDVAAGAGIGLFFASASIYYNKKSGEQFKGPPPITPLIERGTIGLSWSDFF